MKKFKEIMQEINDMPVPMGYFEKQRQDNARWDEATQKGDEAVDALVAELVAEDEQERKTQFRSKVLKHNARIAFVAEYLPTVLECINKYAGKRVGDKTADKIEDELLEKIGHSVVIRNRPHMGAEITFHVLGVFTISAKYDPETKDLYSFFDADGKLRRMTADMFSTHEIEYVEDIDAFYEQKTAELREIKKEAEKLQNKIALFYGLQKNVLPEIKMEVQIPQYLV